MRIKKIQIKNFKSLVEFELEDLKPFCAFVGPNASGKSNIFEALEFFNYVIKFTFEAPRFFGGKTSILSYNSIPINTFLGERDLLFEASLESGLRIYFDGKFSEESDIRFESIGNVNKDQTNNYLIFDGPDSNSRRKILNNWKENGSDYIDDFQLLIDSFSRIFIGKSDLNRTPISSGNLSPDGSNLSQIIGKIFEDDYKRDDFLDWLRILIPEFKDIEIKKSNIDGSFEFFIYEKSSNKPFPKHLISDGTYNILALMAAVYQTDQPQFLCIEEPENGLHPQAIQLLVDFFREKCEEHGHHIWLNTHSQTLVRCMEIDELILVNKVNGETRARQLTKDDEVNLKTDEAWLSNALGGGILWSK